MRRKSITKRKRDNTTGWLKKNCDQVTNEIRRITNQHSEQTLSTEVYLWFAIKIFTSFEELRVFSMPESILMFCISLWSWEIPLHGENLTQSYLMKKKIKLKSESCSRAVIYCTINSNHAQLFEFFPSSVFGGNTGKLRWPSPSPSGNHRKTLSLKKVVFQASTIHVSGCLT